MNTYNLKLPFSQKFSKSYSQAGQDLFVLYCLNGKQNGLFLDLGCNHPTNINNTFILEKEFNWRGISIDIDKSMTDLYANTRTTVALNLDCTVLDFDKIIEIAGSNHFDYLSLDLEPAEVTFACLKSIPFDKISFSVITFEHDFYRFGDGIQKESREIFTKNGYKLICKNVMNNNNSFEDWYYNPKFVSYDDIKILESESKNWQDILMIKPKGFSIKRLLGLA